MQHRHDWLRCDVPDGNGLNYRSREVLVVLRDKRHQRRGQRTVAPGPACVRSRQAARAGNPLVAEGVREPGRNGRNAVRVRSTQYPARRATHEPSLLSLRPSLERRRRNRVKARHSTRIMITLFVRARVWVSVVSIVALWCGSACCRMCYDVHQMSTPRFAFEVTP